MYILLVILINFQM